MTESSYLEKKAEKKAGRISPQNESSGEQSGFERRLFREGVLTFDFDEYVEKANKRLEQSRDWYEKSGWEVRRSAECLALEFEDAQQELVWRQRFSGQVPKRWDIWYRAMHDLEEAGKENIELSSTLVDAGISHPHHLVANTVGQSQRLNQRQLTWTFVRPDLPEWNREQIIEAQVKMGVSEEKIQDAREMAEKIRREVRKRRSGSNSLHGTQHLKELPE